MAVRSAVAEGLAVLDERMRALQTSTARDAAQALEALSRAVAEQATAHAVLAQWMKDWSSEVAAWRKCMEARMEEADARQTSTDRDLEQARGAMRVALWAFGTAFTLVTSVFSGVLVRLLSEVMTQAR